MSSASKVFLVSSMVISGLTVWGVHFLQQRESDTMYQGVLRDEARVREKAALAAAASSAPSHAQPLSTPSAIVRQPAPTIDPDCEVCRISPPPQLVEVQSPSERRAEREAREREYVAQRRLAEDLGRSQSVTEGRLV